MSHAALVRAATVPVLVALLGGCSGSDPSPAATTPPPSASPSLSPTGTATPPSVTTNPGSPSASASASQEATASPTPEPTPIEKCGEVPEEAWVTGGSGAELAVRYAVPQPRFGTCVAVEVSNTGADKASWAVHMGVGPAIESVDYFTGGSVEVAGAGIVLRPTVGDVLRAGETRELCYCTTPGRTSPISYAFQSFPGDSGAYTGLPYVGHSGSPGTLRDDAAGILLEVAPATDVRGTVAGGCIDLRFTNLADAEVDLDAVDLTLNGSGISPRFFPDYVTGAEGGNAVSITFPSAWMPLAAGETLPMTLCLGMLRMPLSASYTIHAAQ